MKNILWNIKYKLNRMKSDGTLWIIYICFLLTIVVAIGGVGFVVIKSVKNKSEEKKYSSDNSTDDSEQVLTVDDEYDNELNVDNAPLASGDALYIYGWDTSFEERLQYFYNKYPQYKDRVKYVVNNSNGVSEEYYKEAVGEIDSSGNKASLVIYDSEAVSQLWETGAFVSMSNLGIDDTDTADMYEPLVDYALHDNKLMGLTWASSPGCYCYRTDVAESVFGSSDPKVLEEYFSSWDGFMNAARILKEKGYYIVPETESVIRCMGKYYNQNILDEISNNGYSKEVGEWTDDWTNCIYDDVFGYLGCDWFVNYIMGGGSEESLPWGVGVCTVPQGYIWGASFIGVTEYCPDFALAKLIIETLCCDSDVMYDMAIDNNEFINNKAVIQKIISENSILWDGSRITTDDVFGVYNGVINKMNSDYTSEYSISESYDDNEVSDDEFKITKDELENEIDFIRDHYYNPTSDDSVIEISAGSGTWSEYSRKYCFYKGNLIFAFVFNGSEDEHRLYFKDDHLIRYIDSNGTIFDYDKTLEFSEWEKKAIAEAYSL